MRYGLTLATLALASFAGSQFAMSESSANACYVSSENCVWRGCEKQQPGSHEMYACFRVCERKFLHCLNTLPPVKDLEADPGKSKKSKKTLPGGAPQPDTVIQ